MTARQKLKAAVAKARHLENQKAQLETALETATTAVETATAELRTFDDLEAEVKKFRVDAVKGGRNGRDLPERLKQRLADRRSAEEEIVQASSTRDAISEELEATRLRLAPLGEEKRKRAIDMLREQADVLAEEVIVLNARRRDLAQILTGLAGLSLFTDGKMQFVGFTQKMTEANSDCNYQFAGNLFPQDDMGKRWLSRLEALLVNPDAELTVPKAIAPSDYSFKSDEWKGPGFPMPMPVVTLRPED